MAGILALGVAACGDDVQLVEPTPPQPPPPPPVTATMAPASASVAVGNSVVFAVNASGGVAGDAASWTCASSNTGIATVSSTSAGCSATGVAAGDVTITASVTKSGETVNVGAQLTVTSDEEPPAPPGDPAFILIQDITGDGDSDESGLTGRVDVKIGVERGDQELEELSLLVDGAVVASQSFGGGMDMGMAPPEEAAEQAVHEFTLSFDSDGYDDHGHPDYANGEHTVSAELEIGIDMADGTHGHETISSNAVPVEFNNSSFIAASVSGLGDGAMNAVTGQVWYGGPDASVEISALPVLYSGSVSSVTLNQFCGDAAATDSEAPFSFEVDCGGFQGSATPTFNVGGSPMTSKGGKVYLDFKAPEAPDFEPNPNSREEGWVNASVGFTAKYEDKKGKRDGWLVYNDKDTDNPASGGVGGYTPQIRFAESGDDNEVGGALAAPALMEVPAAAITALAGQSSKKDAFCVVASAVDLLGNESKLPDADADCVKADDYEADDAGILAGVDLQVPTIAFSPSSPKANAATMRDFQVQLADEGSGIRSKDPLDASVNLRNADDDEKIEDLTVNVTLPLATTDGLPDGVGYYTFTATVLDKAGNSSEETTRTAVHDDMVPVVSTIVGDYNEKTGEYSLVATVTDNLSIKEYWPEMRYTGVTFGANLTLTDPLLLPREGTVSVDAYNAATLTQATLASSLKAHAYRAIQTDAATITNLASISVFANHHGEGMSAAPATPTDPTPTDLTVADNGFDTSADPIAQGTLAAPTPATAADSKVFQTLATTFADSTVSKGGTVEIIVTATGTSGFVAPRAPTDTIDNADTADFDEAAGAAGTQGLRDNPLTRVDIYAAVDRDGGGGTEALMFIGSIAGSAAGAEDFDPTPDDTTNDEDSRRFIYTMEMSAPDFLASVGGKGDYTGDIVAFGVKDNKGVAFATAAEDLTVAR